MDLLINDQMVPKIMVKMPFTDWKEWATKRPEWVRGDLGATFEAYIEKKWKDALNVAAAEPQAWEAEDPRRDMGYQDKPSGGWAPGERPATNARGAAKLVGAANVVHTIRHQGSGDARYRISRGVEGIIRQFTATSFES